VRKDRIQAENDVLATSKTLGREVQETGRTAQHSRQARSDEPQGEPYTEQLGIEDLDSVPLYTPGSTVPVFDSRRKLDLVGTATGEVEGEGKAAIKFVKVDDVDDHRRILGLYAKAVNTGQSSTVFRVNAQFLAKAGYVPGVTPLTVKVFARNFPGL